MSKKTLIILASSFLALHLLASAGPCGAQARPAEPGTELERDALLALWDLLDGAEPGFGADAHVLLSVDTINGFLGVLEGHRLPLSEMPGFEIQIDRAAAVFDPGFPRLSIDGWLQAEGAEAGDEERLRLSVLALLAAAPSPEAPGRLDLSFRLLELAAAEELGGVGRLLAALLESRRQDLIRALPRFSLPLRQELPIALPASRQPVSTQLGKGRLDGELLLPAIVTRLELAVRQVLFLEDGLHVFVSFDGAGAAPWTPAVPAVSAVPAAPAVPAVPAAPEAPAAGELEAEIARLRRLVAERAAPWRIAEVGAGLRISGSAFDKVFRRFNALPADQRVLTFQSTRRHGRIEDKGGGGLGCGWYAELDGDRDLTASLRVGELRAEWRGGRLTATAAFDFEARARVHWHVHGPSAPFSSCRNRIGGGVGGRTPVSARKSGQITLGFELEAAGDSLGYRASIVSPRRLPVTFKAEIQHVGSIGIPHQLELPATPILSGSVPLLVVHEGTLEAPVAGGSSRRYRLELEAAEPRLDDGGLTLPLAASVVRLD